MVSEILTVPDRGGRAVSSIATLRPPWFGHGGRGIIEGLGEFSLRGFRGRCHPLVGTGPTRLGSRRWLCPCCSAPAPAVAIYPPPSRPSIAASPPAAPSSTRRVPPR